MISSGRSSSISWGEPSPYEPAEPGSPSSAPQLAAIQDSVVRGEPEAAEGGTGVDLGVRVAGVGLPVGGRRRWRRRRSTRRGGPARKAAWPTPACPALGRAAPRPRASQAAMRPAWSAGVVVQQRVRHAEQAGLPVVRALEQTGHRLEKDQRARQDGQPQVVPVVRQQPVAPRPFPAVDGPPVEQLEEVALAALVAGQVDGASGALAQRLEQEAVGPSPRSDGWRSAAGSRNTALSVEPTKRSSARGLSSVDAKGSNRRLSNTRPCRLYRATSGLRSST